MSRTLVKKNSLKLIKTDSLEQIPTKIENVLKALENEKGDFILLVNNKEKIEFLKSNFDLQLGEGVSQDMLLKGDFEFSHKDYKLKVY